MKNRLTAAFLAAFFGMFGVHKFYLRNPGAGILFLFIFFMTSRIFPFTLLLGLVDAVRLFMMSDKEFDRKYNRGKTSRDPRRKNRTQNRRRRTPEKRGGAHSAPRQRANPFKKSGIRKYKEYDLEEAIIDFEKGLEIEPSDIALHFNIACAYSLTEQKEKSFFHLSKAVELGYKDFEKITNHDDLAFLRIQPEFENFKTNNYRQEASPQNPTIKEEVKDDKLLAQLNKLKELREKGMITDMDYNMETRKLLNR